MQTQFFFAPGTSPQMQQLAVQFPAASLLDAYREARHKNNTTDLVLIVHDDGIRAGPRTELLAQLNDSMRADHPLLKALQAPAREHLQAPSQLAAFWLWVVLQNGTTGFCAVGSVEAVN